MQHLRKQSRSPAESSEEIRWHLDAISSDTPLGLKYLLVQNLVQYMRRKRLIYVLLQL